MTKYVPYIRTEQGYIERKDYAIFNAHGSLSPYIYEELLEGWPESTVFWITLQVPALAWLLSGTMKNLLSLTSIITNNEENLGLFGRVQEEFR